MSSGTLSGLAGSALLALIWLTTLNGLLPAVASGVCALVTVRLVMAAVRAEQRERARSAR